MLFYKPPDQCVVLQQLGTTCGRYYRLLCFMLMSYALMIPLNYISLRNLEVFLKTCSNNN